MIRILYLYPNEITDELLETIRDNPLIARYFDIPIQHVDSWLLKRMNRRGDETYLRELIAKIRTMMPDAILRTTLIVGFPGETDEMFAKLLNFVETIKFDRLGVFPYSPEEDTPSFDFPDQVRSVVKEKRYAAIMKAQKQVARRQNKAQMGKTHHVIVEQFDPESKFFYGRSYAFAPDDIDGYIVFQSTRNLTIGDDVDVLITASIGYDLIGDAIYKEN
jgi:ribosomal protein S12 methylthiotransferase